jgi:hypothetical protein
VMFIVASERPELWQSKGRWLLSSCGLILRQAGTKRRGVSKWLLWPFYRIRCSPWHNSCTDPQYSTRCTPSPDTNPSCKWSSLQLVDHDIAAAQRSPSTDSSADHHEESSMAELRERWINWRMEKALWKKKWLKQLTSPSNVWCAWILVLFTLLCCLHTFIPIVVLFYAGATLQR